MTFKHTPLCSSTHIQHWQHLMYLGSLPAHLAARMAARTKTLEPIVRQAVF